MSKTRQTFSIEFKQEAASLVLDKDYTYASACQAMGVSLSALKRWVTQLEAERRGVTPVGAKALSADHQKIQALEKRIKQIEWENDVLKKATALLASGSLRKSS